MRSKAPYYELEIRVRQTLAADGTTSSFSTVYCPRHMRTVRVNECIDCEEYIGLGVVSKTDLLRHGVTPEGRVRDIMTSVSFTLHEDQSLSKASALMAYEGIHRLPVVDAAGKVVGLLSSLDILHWLACKTGNSVPSPRSRRGRH